jgi:hypothetical protein
VTSEKRIVRPYGGIARFQAILDSTRLHVGPVVVEPGRSASITSSSFRNDPVKLLIGSDAVMDEVRAEARAALDDLRLAPGDIEFVVVATSPALRLLDVVHRRTLDSPDAVPTHIVMSAEGGTRALEAASAGLDLEVCFALAEELTPRPLAPWRRGTWLGRCRFGLRTELGEIGFTPQPLTEQMRRDNGLHPSTMRYIVVDHEALFDADLADAVDVYVDQELLAMMSRSAHTAGAAAFQRQLFVDVVAAVVTAVAGRDRALELAELEGTVLGRLVGMVAGRGKDDAETTVLREVALRQLANEPHVFVARVEGVAAMKDDLRRTIQGQDE